MSDFTELFEDLLCYFFKTDFVRMWGSPSNETFSLKNNFMAFQSGNGEKYKLEDRQDLCTQKTYKHQYLQKL